MTPQQAINLIKELIKSSLDPYSAFTREPTQEELEQYKQYLQEAGWETVDMENLYDQLIDDLRDDFHNCGGNVLHRMPDIIELSKLFSEEQITDLIEFLSVELYSQIYDK